jgi:hypothetical protein
MDRPGIAQIPSEADWHHGQALKLLHACGTINLLIGIKISVQPGLRIRREKRFERNPPVVPEILRLIDYDCAKTNAGIRLDGAHQSFGRIGFIGIWRESSPQFVKCQDGDTAVLHAPAEIDCQRETAAREKCFLARFRETASIFACQDGFACAGTSTRRSAWDIRNHIENPELLGRKRGNGRVIIFEPIGQWCPQHKRLGQYILQRRQSGRSRTTLSVTT